ncbi:recombinase family protein [Azospirillum doebereinerae]
MLIGYARTSTIDQVAGLDAQVTELTRIGCQKIFREQISAVAMRRPVLETALDYIRDTDTLVVTSLDRLARSMGHLTEVIEIVEKKKANLRILNLAVDTSTATGRLMVTVALGLAAFERERMLERQREGVAKAKAEGKYKGRKPTAMAKAQQVLAMKSDGVGAAEIADRLGIGRASVYRIINMKSHYEPVLAV